MPTPFQEFLSNMQLQQQIKGQQIQNELNQYQVQKEERAMKPGSLENLARQVKAEQSKSYLADISNINKAATAGRAAQAEAATDEAIVQRIDGGEDGQKVLQEYHPGAIYSPIKVAAGVTRPGFKLPGDKTAQFISDKDREEYIAYRRSLSLAKAKSTMKTSKDAEVPTKTELENVQALAAVDQDPNIQDVMSNEEQANAFITLVANEAKKVQSKDRTITWDTAVNIAYDYAKQVHINPGTHTGWFDFALDKEATVSRTPRSLDEERKAKVKAILGK